MSKWRTAIVFMLADHRNGLPGQRMERISDDNIRCRSEHSGKGRVVQTGAIPIPDLLKVGADGRLYVTDIAANGIYVLKRPPATRHTTRRLVLV